MPEDLAPSDPGANPPALPKVDAEQPAPAEPAPAELPPTLQEASAAALGTDNTPPADEAPSADEPAALAEDSEDEEDEPTAAAEPVLVEAPSNKHWYVVKVQSGREETIKEAIERRVKKEGLEEFFGQIYIPVERVTEMRNSKRVIKERKLFPGYLMVEVEYNDRILYLFRETSGVGDFVGGTVNRPPPPMAPREVERMLGNKGQQTVGTVTSKPKFDQGDRVKVRDGTFAGMEGEVKEILETLGHVRVELTIFGRPVPVELEYWQVEQV
jgi:transcriptional antiterminator NusG